MPPCHAVLQLVVAFSLVAGIPCALGALLFPDPEESKEELLGHVVKSPQRKRRKSEPGPYDPPPASHALLKDDEGKCKICDTEECICSKEVKNLFVHQEAFYDTASGRKEPWVCVLGDAQKSFLGCTLCMKYLGNNGVKGAPGNSKIHHGKMNVTKSISIDTLKGHIGYEPNRNTSAHTRAFGAYQADMAGTDIQEDTKKEPNRRDFAPKPALLNQCLVAYTTLKMPLSAASYHTVAGLCRTVGGETCLARYQDHYFLGEFLSALNTVLWEDNARFVKNCEQIRLYIDIADGFLIIRVSGLTEKKRLRTIFWQARNMAKKGARDIAAAILRAFTVSPPGVSEEFAMTEAEFLKKLSLLVADGASENGVRSNGQPCDQAKEGQNVLWYLQSRKDELTDDKIKILAYWCSSHKLNLVSAAPEKSIAWVAVIMTFLRSLVGHIVYSSKAQNTLKWLSTLVDEDMEHATKSMASVHYAPQRFLSAVQPLSVICDRIEEVIIYLKTLTFEDNTKAVKTWAEGMLNVMDLRFFMVVPGLLDILTVLNDFNKGTQPRSTRAETVADKLSLAKQRLQDVILRTRTEALGLEQSTIVKAMYQWLKGTHPAKVGKDSTNFEKMCFALRSC